MIPSARGCSCHPMKMTTPAPTTPPRITATKTDANQRVGFMALPSRVFSITKLFGLAVKSFWPCMTGAHTAGEITTWPLPSCLLCFLLVWLEESQPSALGLGVQTGHCSTQGKSLVLSEAEALGNHGCPQGQDRRSVDGDGSSRHASCIFASPDS